MITKQNVLDAQKEWANGIIKIGSCMDQRSLCEKEAEVLIDRLYAFDLGTVLFKPTKAHHIQFRLDKKGAISYFVGGNNEYPEDHGFAINPWIKIWFDNAGLILEKKRALAMGNYYFVDNKGVEIKVEYTFGYIQSNSEFLKIDLHHSSLPYQV